MIDLTFFLFIRSLIPQNLKNSNKLKTRSIFYLIKNVFKYLLANNRHSNVANFNKFHVCKFCSSRDSSKDSRSYFIYTGLILPLSRIGIVLSECSPEVRLKLAEITEVVMRRYKSEQWYNNFAPFCGLHFYDSNAFG